MLQREDMKHGAIIQIDDCLVSEDILTEYFSCDYGKCRGCCCIIGDSGAPLHESELEAIEKNYPVFSAMMRPQGRDCFDGDGNCFCAMEKCWFQGNGDFRKPISCWLYPIRVSELSNGMKALNLHRWDICRDAFEKGRKEKVRVYEFLREPIERFFGKDFYSALCEASRILTA